jgi:hypothetical protein
MSSYKLTHEPSGDNGTSETGPTTLYLEVSTPDSELGCGPSGDGFPFDMPPLSYLHDSPTPWFIPSSDPGGGDYPPFCGTPPSPGGGPVIMPSVDTPPAPNDPLDCW